MRPSVVMADLRIRLPVAELHTRTGSRGSRVVVHVRADVRPFVRAIHRLQWRLFWLSLGMRWHLWCDRIARWWRTLRHGGHHA